MRALGPANPTKRVALAESALETKVVVASSFVWVMGNHDQFIEDAKSDDELRAMYPAKYRRFAKTFSLTKCYYDQRDGCVKGSWRGAGASLGVGNGM